jgi:hypothetical protein
VDGTLDILGNGATLTLYDVGSESHWTNHIRLGNTSGKTIWDKDDHWRGDTGDFTNGPPPFQLVGSATHDSGISVFEFWRMTPDPDVLIVVNGQSPMMMVEGYGYASIALAYLNDAYQIVSGPTDRVLVLLEDGGEDRDYDDYVGVLEASSAAVVKIPNVVGLTQSVASTTLSNAGLTLGSVTQRSSSTVPAGSVISQSPIAGFFLALDLPVDLVVSSGLVTAPVSVPNVVGLTQSVASTTLSNAGLTLGAVTQQSSDTVPAGNVISQSPSAGTSVSPGSAVNLVVSSGPAPVIPDAPTLYSAAAQGNRVLLSWSDVTGETGYEIGWAKFNKGQQSCNSLSVLGAVGPDTTTSTDTRNGGGTFCYAVRAFNSAGLSAWSNVVTVTVQK